MRLETARTLAAIGVLALVVTACGDDGGVSTTTAAPATTGGETTITAAPTTTTTPTTTIVATTLPATTTTVPPTTTTTSPPFSGDTEPKSHLEITGTPGPLVDVRIGDHDGFTRVVFDFEGDGEHWWTVGYVAGIAGGGSGLPCDVAGTHLLEVVVQHASAFWIEQTYFGPLEINPSFGSVTEVKFCDDFEAVLQHGIGVDGERPFDVFVVQDPLRLVVDIAD